MVQPANRAVTAGSAEPPDTSHLITDDGAAVDSFFAEKQQRLFAEALSAWRHPEGRSFICAVDVGIFALARNPPIVPDGFVSFDVEIPRLVGADAVRSYFLWEFGKPPDIVLEIVSQEDGGELTTKLRAFEKLRVSHYLVFDPLRTLSTVVLRSFGLQEGVFVERPNATFPRFGLALTMWRGSFEGQDEDWLRWAELDGTLLPTTAEHARRADGEAKRADDEAKRADDEAKRADDEAKRADQAAERTRMLEEQLRALGAEPRK